MVDKFDPNKIPSLEEIEKILKEINDADFSVLSYKRLLNALQSLQIIPFVTANLKKGFHIERARINNPNQIFYSEHEISYRTDYQNIKKYGRANEPYFPLFYGAFQSDIIEHPRLVSLFETSEIFRNLDTEEVDEADFIMTVGKWEIKEDIEVVEIVFDEESIKNSPNIKRSYDFQVKNLTEKLPGQKDKIEKILTFFSNQFAKKEIKSHFDYMVSAAYADLAINYRNHMGLTYPSVKTDYQGQNVVLTPSVVENYLELKIVSMFRVKKEGKETIVSPLKNTTEFGPLNTNFKWEDAKPKKIIANP